MNIKIDNNLPKSSTFSYVSSNSTAGDGTIQIRNVNTFTPQWAVQFGDTGEETAEICLLSTVGTTATTIIVSGTTRFNHPIDTPIYNIHFDQVVVKRSTVGTAGTATAIGTTSITPDSSYTQYVDTTGLDTYAYKTQFRDSLTADLSAESDWFFPGGPYFYSLSKIRQRVKDNLFNSTYINSDDTIDTWINEWVEMMTNSAIKANQDYSLGTTAVAFGTDGMGTVTDRDFKQARKVELQFNGGTSYVDSTQIPINQFSRSQSYNSFYPKHYWRGDSVFGVLPTGIAGTAFITYNKRSTILSNDADEIPVSLRAYTTNCNDWAQYRAYNLDQNAEMSKVAYQNFLLGKHDFITEITPRDQSGIKFMQMDDSLGGREEDLAIDY